ncbi:dihydrolipoamide acetyltransferase family protein [Saccharicrinis sp. FJH62]|uniref:dihydrolipoamide acetyltransferase family protein n=1 Tax=Saccharicrinis sp. FJH62 TaxID=3344657 RepID=UPI0035D4A766
MAQAVIMPKQGQSVEVCIISDWFKNVGDTVSKGDVLFSYETDKASFEEEAPCDGVLLARFYEAGDEVPVLLNVCVIGSEGEDVSEFKPEGGAEAEPETEVAAVPEKEEKAAPVEKKAEAPVQPKENVEFTGVSPRAKNLAKKEGLDPKSLEGTGPEGRVIERDVKDAMSSRPKATPLAKKMMSSEGLSASAGSGLGGRITSKDLAAAPNIVYGEDYEIKPLTQIRKLIAKAMHASLQNSAQLTHHLSADARRMLELRKKVKAAMADGYDTNITLNDMVCYAVVKALKKFPQANSHFLGEEMRLFKKVHLGLAVDTERGLMVPAIKNADDLSIKGLSNQMGTVAAACRKGAIDPSLLASEAASFTVSNLGNYGVEMFTPVINLPQSAILGVNTILPRPKDLGDGMYGFVPHIGLSLTYDHRALDGGEATRFLKQIAIEIENLEFEL